MDEQTWKKLIKEHGCHYKELRLVLGEYANTPEYLRFYIELKAKQQGREEFARDLIKDIDKHQASKGLKDFDIEIFKLIKKTLRKQIERGGG